MRRHFFFFLVFILVCWHELKAHCPHKKIESSLIRKEKKKQEKCLRLLADLSAWQTGEVTVAVFGIFKILQIKKRKTKWCRSRYIDDVVMLEISLESDIWRCFNFKWGREACPELPCHCRSGWVHSPCCSTRYPSQGSGHALGWEPLETVSPRHCSGNQPEYGRIPVDQRRREEVTSS